MNKKIRDFITILIIQLVISLPFYISNVHGISITTVRVSNITSNSATVEWNTDVNSDGKVNYGTTTTLGLADTHSNLVTNHKIIVTNSINPGTRYFFSVESKDASDNVVVNNNTDNFYTFTTKTVSSSSTTTQTTTVDTTPPEINFSIPGHVNRRVIDIAATTEPFTSVKLFVNDLNTPKRSLSNDQVGRTGKFAFTQVPLQDQNVIKIALEDQAGNKNEKTFDVAVDTDDPVVKLDNLTSLTSQKNLTISGVVNEEVTMKVFIDSDSNGSSIPSKITGLNVTKTGQNSVELEWGQSTDTDFSHYVVYRDSTPIATAQPANFNLFIDALVDSGQTYTYEVSAVNIFANEGPKSDAATVKTLTGGSTLNLQHDPVDIFEDFRKPLLSITANDRFNFGINLNKGDGNYNIKLVFEDKARNKVTIEKKVLLDTQKPKVKIITPQGGAFIFENAANQVDVAGTTKPNSRVHLFINRAPFASYNASFQFTALPNEILNIAETDLDAKCRFNVGTSSACKGADKSTTADSQGNFRFDNVDLTATLGLGTSLRQVPVTEFRDTQLNLDTRDAKKTELLVISTDQLGQRGFARRSVGIGTCWSGNQSWDLIPLTQYQSPSLISTERLAEGSETLYFYFNFSYIGRGSNAKIQNVHLSRACSRTESTDPRFNISCQIMPAGGSPTRLNPDGTITYTAVPLNRYESMDTFLEDDWRSFLKSINDEFSFPFRVRISYEHDVLDGAGIVRRMRETQTTCQEVGYVVDSTLIDFRRLPDFLLYDFVDLLDKSIAALTKVQDSIQRVIDYVAFGCLYSFLGHLAVKVYRTWVDISNELLFNNVLKNFLNFNTGNTVNDEECKAYIKQLEGTYGEGNVKLRFVSDPQLKKCFPSSYNAWQRETKFYEFRRWSCDRIFGHSSPSKWTESKSDKDLQRKLESFESCDSDESVRGLNLRAENCKSLDLSAFDRDKTRFDLDTKCFTTVIDNQRVLLTLGDRVQGEQNIYELDELVNPSRAEISYAIKKKGSETDFLTAAPKSCAELCGIKRQNTRQKLVLNGVEVPLSADPQDRGGQSRVAYCTTADTCKSWNANEEIVDTTGTRHKIESAFRVGYANSVSDTDQSSCFYDSGKSASVVSDSPATREECCCINVKEDELPFQYYEPSDTDKATGEKIHESDEDSGSVLQQSFANDYEDMKWSYRYSRIGFEAKGSKQNEIHNEYNPYRYTERRDLPACFGQNNLFYKIFGKEEDVLVLDPFKQDTAALQCAYLTGINQRLQMYKNIMGAMSSCLIEVRTSGRGDIGVCKELFTQHVCGAVWQVANFFSNGCTPDEPPKDIGDGRDEKIGEKISRGLRGISEGISEAQEEFTQDYGNVKLENLLQTGQGGIQRKICLAAFGYDWDLTATNLVDAAYTSPFATLVQPITRSREFLTVDPIKLLPKYEYRSSWIINPGCDLENYKVELACVTRQEMEEHPNSINCGAVGAPSIAGTGQAPFTGPSTGFTECDCLELNQATGPTHHIFTGNRIQQNDLIEKDIHKVVEDIHRYDHIKFTLRTDRRIPQQVRQNCFPTGFEDGVFYRPLTDKTPYDIVDCNVDPLSGVFSCGDGTAFFESQGIAQLVEVTINDINPENVRNEELTFEVGKPLTVGARVTKSGQDKCFRVSIGPDIIQPQIRGILMDGTSDIPPVELTRELRIAGRSGNVVAPGITYNPISQNNQQPVTIDVKFFDTPERDDQSNSGGVGIYSIDDTIIIDKWIINLEQGTVTQNINDPANPDTNITLNGKNIIINKQGASIEITGVSYNAVEDTTMAQTAPVPDRADPPTRVFSHELQTIITINPFQQSTKTRERKTITVEILNIKGNAGIYNNPDDCNTNDPIVQKSYNFIVSEAGIDTSRLGPIIPRPTFTPSTPLTSSTIEISVKVNHPGVPIESVTMTIHGPDGTVVVRDKQMYYIDSLIGYTTKVELLEKTGNYKVTIKARTNTNQESINEFDLQVVPSR